MAGTIHSLEVRYMASVTRTTGVTCMASVSGMASIPQMANAILIVTTVFKIFFVGLMCPLRVHFITLSTQMSTNFICIHLRVFHYHPRSISFPL